MIIAHTANCEGKVQYLKDHLHNVATRMKSTLEPIGLSSMGEIIGLLHDIGKAQDAWQLYIQDPKRVAAHPGHSQFGRIAYNQRIFPLPDCNDEEAVEDYRYAMAQVIFSHHSALHDDVDFDQMDFALETEWKRTSTDNEVTDAEILDLCLNELSMDLPTIRAIFEKGFEEFSNTRSEIRRRNHVHYKDNPENVKNAISFEMNLLNNLLLSALMDADWLDTQNHEDGIYRAEEQMTPNWEDLIRPFEKEISKFVPNTFINKIRIEVSEACRSAADRDPDHSAYKLSVFCGGGKTLASTRYALHHAKKHAKRHVFYVIPFTSIIEQNASVLRETCHADDDNLLEHHCNAGLDLNADISEITEKEDDNGYLRKTVSRYDVPMIMTTQVRFLTTVFSKDKKSRRLLADYINSEIIFDEFQAMPIKLLDMFYIAAEFMTHVMHCNIILSSATQAISSTFGLSESSFLTGIDWNAKYADKLGRARFLDLSTYSNPQSPVMSLGDIGDLIESELIERNSCLVIVNSRAQARDLFQNLECRLPDDVSLYHLSTNMFPRHRKQVLDEMIKTLKTDQDKVVCISTSLIEAGVDVSFGTVIRYLNGFDNIVQSGGRCNRHADSNYIGHVYIVNEPKAIPMYKNQQDATGTVIGIHGKDLTDKLNVGLEDYYADYIDRIGGDETKFKYELDGNVKYKTTLTDLWGDNSVYIDHHPSNLPFLSEGNKVPKHHSLVRTAQRAFSVIESNNNEIVICNDDRCAVLLDAYENASSFKVLIEIQRHLQQYSVGLTWKDYKSIANALTIRSNGILGTSVSVLSWDACYNEKYGIAPVDDNDLIF